jgi:hypothetical protein
MKKILFISLICLSFSATNISAEKNQVLETKVETNDQTRTLKGLVSDKLTQETLAGAIITYNGQKVYTDLDGNFSLSNLCGSKCQIKVSLISYVDELIEIDTNNLKPIQIKLQHR